MISTAEPSADGQIVRYQVSPTRMLGNIPVSVLRGDLMLDTRYLMLDAGCQMGIQQTHSVAAPTCRPVGGRIEYRASSIGWGGGGKGVYCTSAQMNN